MTASRPMLAILLATCVACNGPEEDPKVEDTDVAAPGGNTTDTQDTDAPDTDAPDQVDPQTVDGDGDGVTPAEGDCDDGNDAVNPNATETCNGIDDDCNDTIDDDPVDGTTYYADSDMDGFGDIDTTIRACELPAGYTTDTSDCDDTQITANPDGTEINWNRIDEDCDGRDYALRDCINAAVDATSDYMIDGAWLVNDYTGAYVDPFLSTIPLAEWSMTFQYLYLIDEGTSINASPGSEDYSVRFDTRVGMNQQSDPFYLDVTTSVLLDAIGIDYTTYCDGYVNPVPMNIAGSLSVTVDPSSQSVTGSANLTDARSLLTQDMVTMFDPISGNICNIVIVDQLLALAGYDPLLTVIDESFSNTTLAVVTEYETQLEAQIDALCSAN